MYLAVEFMILVPSHFGLIRLMDPHSNVGIEARTRHIFLQIHVLFTKLLDLRTASKVLKGCGNISKRL